MIGDLRTVLVIMAHPDDPEFFCGGTLARWIDEGKEVRYLLATSGGRGTGDPADTTGQLMLLREAEQRAAAEVLGVREVIFLRQQDGELTADLQLRLQLVRHIRLYRPDVIVTSDPTRFFADDLRPSHPDHRVIGDAALSAAFPAAGNWRFFPELWQTEGLAPHTPRQVLIARPDQPNCEVDITATLERKIQAILRHESQLVDPGEQLARVRRRTAREDGRHVEQFRRIVLR